MDGLKMENPIFNWMIWGFSHIFGNTHISFTPRVPCPLWIRGPLAVFGVFDVDQTMDFITLSPRL